MNRMQNWTACIAAALGLIVASDSNAQAPPVRNQPPAGTPAAGAPNRQTVLRPVQPGGAANAQATDEEIAAMLLIDAQGEVKMGQFAETHASSSEAKDLARHLVADHSKTVATLQRLAGPLAATVMAQPGGKPAGGAFDVVTVKKQIAEECSAWMEKELSEKQGPEFDRAFAGSQMGAHMHVICAQKVLRQYAGPELQKAINEDSRMAQEHFDMAKAIVDQPNSAGGGIQIPKTNSAK